MILKVSTLFEVLSTHWFNLHFYVQDINCHSHNQFAAKFIKTRQSDLFCSTWICRYWEHCHPCMLVHTIGLYACFEACEAAKNFEHVGRDGARIDT
jgi:hypothetical protein